MARARRSRSGCPCGRTPRWVAFAAVKREAEAFGHAATQAPQPMQAALSMAQSASPFGIGRALASCGVPVGALIYPPAWMIRSNADRSTTRSFTTGNALARHGSIQMASPSLKLRMWS